MEALFDLQTLGIGILIYLSRVCDVSMGTVRTIVTVQGRIYLAFFLGLIEITIWITVVSTVIVKIEEAPILILFYSLGYASGNVAGILLERKLAFGMINLRIMSLKKGKELASRLRELGQPVTEFQGEGRSGPVTELYAVCRRRDFKRYISIIKEVDPDSFYVTEIVGGVNKLLRPVNQPITGWRSRFKKK